MFKCFIKSPRSPEGDKLQSTTLNKTICHFLTLDSYIKLFGVINQTAKVMLFVEMQK